MNIQLPECRTLDVSDLLISLLTSYHFHEGEGGSSGILTGFILVLLFSES